MDRRLIEIKQQPWLCREPFSTVDFRIHDGKVKLTCCCNLDLGETDQEMDFAFLEKVRTEMRAKIVPTACGLCTRDEANDAISERMRYMRHLPDADFQRFADTFETHEVQIGMKFSNKCSLACRSCNPQDSSLWAKTMATPAPEEFTQDLGLDERYWEAITGEITRKYSQNKNIIIHPIGGETLIQPGFHKLITWLVDSRIAPDATLRLTTSLAANLTDEFIAQLKKFRKITFLSSIDSVGENYHYVRWPAKFDKVESSLDRVVEMIRENPRQVEISVTPVFSINNIFYIGDFLDWWQAWAKERDLSLWMDTIHLYNPTFLAVEVLPEPYRAGLAQQLERTISHEIFDHHPLTHVIRDYMVSMLKILREGVANEDKFTTYLKFTADYDRRTSIDSFVLNSRLFDMLTPEHREIYHQHHRTVSVSQPVFYRP